MSFSFKAKYRRASLALEYAFLFSVLVGAIIAMNIYMKRSFQGRYRMLGDELGAQYEPGATTIDNTTTTTTVSHEYEIPSTADETKNDNAIESTTDVTEDKYEEVAGY